MGSLRMVMANWRLLEGFLQSSFASVHKDFDSALCMQSCRCEGVVDWQVS